MNTDSSFELVGSKSLSLGTECGCSGGEFSLPLFRLVRSLDIFSTKKSANLSASCKDFRRSGASFLKPGSH